MLDFNRISLNAERNFKNLKNLQSMYLYISIKLWYGKPTDASNYRISNASEKALQFSNIKKENEILERL